MHNNAMSRSAPITPPHFTQAQHQFQVDVDDIALASKVRLDAYLAGKLPHTSRARLQASIKEGLITVNGRPQSKASYAVKVGDTVHCSVLPPPPLEAAPEDIPLDIVFEDEHLIIVNKSADMVMHPSPGHYTGTMVNALLFHCGLPAVRLSSSEDLPPPALNSLNIDFNAVTIREDDDEDDDVEDDDVLLPELIMENNSNNSSSSSAAAAIIRPGIVHRLDKGTTGLVVIAKTDVAHTSLCRQFKDHSIKREYQGLTLGVPRPPSGRVATNIGRDFRDRKKMAAFAYASARGRVAASNYQLLEVVAGGRGALVQWRLETGRTHQIRVHSKHIGHPLIGDEAYGGGSGPAASVLGGGKSTRIAAVHAVLKLLNRPALHAKSLGIDHPVTGERLEFESELPPDFVEVLKILNSAQF